jgi:hypothetical protein
MRAMYVQIPIVVAATLTIFISTHNTLIATNCSKGVHQMYATIGNISRHHGAVAAQTASSTSNSSSTTSGSNRRGSAFRHVATAVARWSLGPTYLLEEPLSLITARLLFAVGTRYTGLFHGEDGDGSVPLIADGCGPGVLTEVLLRGQQQALLQQHTEEVDEGSSSSSVKSRSPFIMQHRCVIMQLASLLLLIQHLTYSVQCACSQ